MNKAQKIIMAIALLVMFFILIYPPKVYITRDGNLFPFGRGIIFSFPKSEYVAGFSQLQIDIKRLSVELLAIACMGGALVILFGLKTRR